MSNARERIQDLQVERVTAGLGTAAQAELEALVAEHGDADGEHLELAAAVVDLAFFEEIDEMPAALRSRLEGEAGRFLSHRGADSGGADSAARDGARSDVVEWPGRAADGAPEVAAAGGAVLPLVHGRQAAPRSVATTGAWPWVLAAAALVAAVIGWARPGVEPLRVEQARVSSLEDRRQSLLESDGVLQLAWSTTEDAAAVGVEGDVVWSPQRQRGFMRFRGLAANDPSELQYQLWIFDATRDDRYPIDGGVFDIEAGEASADGDFVVPIRAKLPVREAALFAVTVEAPGGVVVSSRERIVTLAQVG